MAMGWPETNRKAGAEKARPAVVGMT